MPDKKHPDTTPELDAESKLKPHHSPRWSVVVLDDPVNTINYVTHVFCKVFDYTKERSGRHTLEAHQSGRSLLWSGHRERAEHYVITLHKWQINAILESGE